MRWACRLTASYRKCCDSLAVRGNDFYEKDKTPCPKSSTLPEGGKKARHQATAHKTLDAIGLHSCGHRCLDRRWQLAGGEGSATPRDDPLTPPLSATPLSSNADFSHPRQRCDF
jgi:hypothetical protein